MNCINCKYYVKKDDGEYECHRYPPLVMSEFTSRYPKPFILSWCGEFKRMEE